MKDLAKRFILWTLVVLLAISTPIAQVAADEAGSEEVILQEEMTNTQTTMITLTFPSGHDDQQNTQITTLR